MLLSEIFQRCAIQAGMFQLSPDAIELRGNAFEITVNNCLGLYNKYSPHDMHIYKNISQSRAYTFTEENTPEGIPDSIVDMIPSRIAGVYPFFLFDSSKQNTNLEIKESLPFEYRKPIVYISVQGEYDIHCVFHHKLTRNADGILECKTLTDNDVGFFKYLTSQFMEAIGRNRRAFTMNALPIESDAENMVSDARDLAKETLDELQNIHMKFYLAWRG